MGPSTHKAWILAMRSGTNVVSIGDNGCTVTVVQSLVQYLLSYGNTPNHPVCFNVVTNQLFII